MLHIHHRKYIEIGLIFLGSWVIGTVLIHHLEHGYPIGESYFNALYFTIITTATIGFGDLVPMTIGGKILTMGYAIFYVPLFLYSMNVVFQTNFRRIQRQDAMLEREMHNVEKDVERIIEDEPGESQSTPRRKFTTKK